MVYYDLLPSPNPLTHHSLDSTVYRLKGLFTPSICQLQYTFVSFSMFSYKKSCKSEMKSLQQQSMVAT